MTNTSPTLAVITAVPQVPVRARRAVKNMKLLATDPITGEQYPNRSHVIWDEKNSALDTWQRALAYAGDEPVLILEDDVRLAPAFRTKVEQVIASKPDSVIQFFSMRKADETVGARYEPGRTFLMNQCVYYPALAARTLLDYSKKWQYHGDQDRAELEHDVCVRAWLKSNGLHYWLHVPSLVQHENWASEINPTRSTKRQSETFGQQDPGLTD